jgi:hypothetical protein
MGGFAASDDDIERQMTASDDEPPKATSKSKPKSASKLSKTSKRVVSPETIDSDSDAKPKRKREVRMCPFSLTPAIPRVFHVERVRRAARKEADR